MFTEAQIAQLTAPLASANVKSRSQSGRSLSYVEGWHVINEANRIFGFGAWSSETVEIKCVSERERKIGAQQKDGWGVTYTCRVRVTVQDHGQTVVRDGCGTGHGIDVDLGQAHESALKESETDARKRALMTFGNPFGLALYDKEQRNVSDEAAPAKQPKAAVPTNTPLPAGLEPKPHASERPEIAEYLQKVSGLLDNCINDEEIDSVLKAGATQRKSIGLLEGSPYWGAFKTLVSAARQAVEAQVPA